MIFSNNRLLDSLLRGTTVGYLSDSLASSYVFAHCLRQKFMDRFTSNQEKN